MLCCCKYADDWWSAPASLVWSFVSIQSLRGRNGQLPELKRILRSKLGVSMRFSTLDWQRKAAIDIICLEMFRNEDKESDGVDVEKRSRLNRGNIERTIDNLNLLLEESGRLEILASTETFSHS
jgi:hypothetical protein